MQRCPVCGLQIVQQAKFCTKCGYGLSSGPARSPVGQSGRPTCIPKFLADKILAIAHEEVGGRKIATVLSADVADYGPISEKLEPTQVYEVIDKLFAILTDEIVRYGGSISQVTGNGILALFGALPAREDHAQAACHAALNIQIALDEYNRRLEKRFAVNLEIKIGLNSGPVLVGSIVEDLTGDYTEVGNTANLAYEVQRLAETGAIYVTEETFKRSEGFFIFQELKDVETRLNPPIRAFRLVSTNSRLTSFDVRATRGLTPFVGRKRELGRLLEGLAVCTEGGCRVISISAGPGLGKSRILHEFRKAIIGRDITFVEGKCLSYAIGVPYYPFVRILKDRFGIQDDDGQVETRRKVREGLESSHADDNRMLPYVLELLSVRESGIDTIPMSSQSRRDRVWESLARVLLKGSESKPLILAIEDLHWCDKASLAFIEHLLEIMPGQEILVLFSYRPGFSPSWAKLFHHQVVTLDRLSEEEGAAMIKHLIGATEIEPELVELILDKSEGVPFFIEEFFRSWKDLEIIEQRGKGYHLARRGNGFVIPSTINDIIMSRVDTLPERTKALLYTGAAIERQFSYNLIRKIMEIPEEELSSHLQLLKASGLLDEACSSDESEYVFRHALIRDVIYDSTSAARKKAFHEKTGDAIEEIYPDSHSEHSEELLNHYLRSENFQKAAKYAELAGKKARKIASFPDSVRYARERVACLGRLPRTSQVDRDLIDARTAMGLYLLQMNHHVEAKQAVDPIIPMAHEGGNKRRLSQIYTIVGTYHCLIEEEFEKGLRYLDEGLKISQDLNDILSLVTAKVWLGITLPPTGAFEKALHFLGEALEINVAAGALWSISMVKSLMGFVVHNYTGRLDLGLQTAQEALHIAETAGDRLSRGIAHGSLGMNYYYQGRLLDAERHLSRSVTLLDGANFFWEAVVYLFLGFTYFEMGRFDASKNCYSKSTSVLESAHLAQSIARFNKVATLWAEVSDGRRDLEPDELFKIYQENKYAVLSGWIARILAEISIAIDSRDLTMAEIWIRAAIVADERIGMKVHLGRDYLLQAQLCKRKGEVGESRTFLNLAKELFRQCGAYGDLRKCEQELP